MNLTWVKQNLSLLFKRPVRHQVAALCYRDSEQGCEVLLITSRGGGRWIFPKGWPMLDRSDGESALQEAWEEAGVRGNIIGPKVGHYISKKKLRNNFNVSIKTDVYAVEVTLQDSSYPEAGQRQLAWHSIEEAIRQVDEDGMSYILKKWEAKSK